VPRISLLERLQEGGCRIKSGMARRIMLRRLSLASHEDSRGVFASLRAHWAAAPGSGRRGEAGMLRLAGKKKAPLPERGRLSCVSRETLRQIVDVVRAREALWPPAL
jgi:hypothetical protein